MVAWSLSRHLLLLLGLLAEPALSEVALGPAALQRSPPVAPRRPVAVGEDEDDAPGKFRRAAPLTPAQYLRSPLPRFSESIGGQDNEITGSGGTEMAESPTSETARFDVGPPLTPQDFAMGEEPLATPASVPLVAGRIDPIELAGQFEGDIMLTEDDLRAVTGGAVPGSRIWTGGVIRYVIASGFSSAERGVIASAIYQLEGRTCVGMHPLPPGVPSGDFLHIVRGSGCSSAVGRVGGNQTLSLSEGCFTRGVVLHQLLHAAGLWHEQSRPDRYKHVRVLNENVAPGRLFDLRTYARDPPQSTSGYQRRSLMHLSRWAFSVDRQRPTLESTYDPGESLGQRDGMTREDARAVNMLYSCSDGTPPPLPAQPQPDQRCEDQNQHCKWWAQRGECSRNKAYMHSFCTKSCRRCTGTCEDLDRNCGKWTALNLCNRHASYMHVYCRPACGQCRPAPPPSPPPPQQPGQLCEDKIAYCRAWAGRGECIHYVQYMTEHCRRSCGRC